ncbi:putative sodium-dependent transporter (di-or tri-carboxylates) [Pseudoalteromonas luteoviolacea B = ATCC 29581]|nr:putative sodium-dependent transporter (di-or tri-carboxylates) [Pseudoalteromonas luteoviolacea B = ATCC 29581]
METPTRADASFFFLLLGPLCFLFTLFSDAPTNMPDIAWKTTGLALWMGIWWVSEAVPIPVTSLLPLIVFPIAGIAQMDEASKSYAHPLIFLFLGGFLLSIAMEKWSLHQRIALHVMVKSGHRPDAQILAMMSVSAFLSMWINNTATTLMMLPIALSVIHVLEKKGVNVENYGKALLLGIAYSASIGGVATIIGTAPNALMVAFLADSYQIKISFAQWMIMGVPFASLMVLIGWWWLTRYAFKLEGHSDSCFQTTVFKKQLSELGTMQFAEKQVLLVFLFAAISWVSRPLFVKWTGLNITDTGIAMIAALMLFTLPAQRDFSQRVLYWRDTQSVPWGILLLFGGGLALAAQIKQSGLAHYVAMSLTSLDVLPIILGIVIVTALITFLTELTSNTATAAGFLPLLAPVAMELTGSPLVWVIPAAMAASCAFMMPVATPPNAIVFGSDRISIRDMVRAGFAMNLFAITIISLLTVVIASFVFGFNV